MPAQPDPAFFARLEAALPLDDLLAWILREHPEASEREVLTLVQKVCERDYVIRPSAREERSYTVGGQPWRTFPQSVAPRAKA
ncbi:MAG TPA: hypothetical protein VF530_03400 [Planctomycetota bacterium]